MTVWLYCIVRNEARILPYFLRHYTPWVDKLIFYDGKSDDGTRELITEHPKCELRDWPGSDALVDDEFLEFSHIQQQEGLSAADWVVWVDADEFLYHHDMHSLLLGYLKDGIELPRIAGYTMLSPTFPVTGRQLIDEVKTGIFDDCWSKHIIFRKSIRWYPGRHGLNASQLPVMSPSADIKLLHYRCLGMAYLRWRHERNWNRVPEHCRNKNYGVNCEPNHREHHGISWFEDRLREPLVEVI